MYLKQTAESIAVDCNEKHLFLVCLAWNLCSKEIVLKAPPMPNLNTRSVVPDFTMVYGGPNNSKRASDYLSSQAWVDMLCSVVEGVHAVTITDKLKEKADSLALSLESRLGSHVV